jgi:hypothetical protein
VPWPGFAADRGSSDPQGGEKVARLQAPAPQYSRIATGPHTSLHGRRTASASKLLDRCRESRDPRQADKAAEWEHVQFFI